MRMPKKYVARSGKVTWKVRYVLNSEDSSLTFSGPDAEGNAMAFALMLDASDAATAIAWQQRKDAEGGKLDLLTLDQWAEKYIEMRTAVTDGTRFGYEKLYELTFKPIIGHLPLEFVTHEDVSKAIIELSSKGSRGVKNRKPYSDKSMRNAYGLLASMFKEATADGRIAKNPCLRIKLPRRTSHNRADMVLLTAEDFEAIVGKMSKHYRPLVITMGGTGIRWGEAEALTVGDVNVKARTLRVNKAAKWDTSKAQRTVGPTKTRMSDRTVTLPQAVVDVLKPLLKGRQKGERLFLAPKGGPLSHKSFWLYAWKPACEAAGFSNPRPRIHDLRHTHASWLIEKGVGLTVIQRRLGHSSIKVTSDTYGHLSPDIQRAAADVANLVLMGTPAIAS